MTKAEVLAFAKRGATLRAMSDSAHAYELPADQTVPADAVREAVDGEVVYLTRDGTPVAAVVSADAADYLEALEDAADIIAARRALAEQAPSVPAEQVWAELGLDDRG
jgi:prevent-host-death family protein